MKPRPISEYMRHILRRADDGKGLYAGCHGRSEYGGRTRAIAALYRRKLLECVDGEDRITEAGLREIEERKSSDVERA